MELRFNSKLLENVQLKRDEAQEIVERAPEILHLQKMGRINADESLVSARELVQIEKTLYKTQFPMFMADKLAPVGTSHHTGVQSVGYNILEPTGMAEVVDDESKDPQETEIFKKEFTQPVVTLMTHVRWNIQDVRQATLAQMSSLSANYSFTEEKTRAALFSMKRKEEDIFVQGDSKHNVVGFCNNTNITKLATSSKQWSTMTAEELVAEINKLLNGISAASKSVFYANTVLLPVDQFDIIASKPFSGTNGTALETVLSFIRRTRQEAGNPVEFVRYPYLDLLEDSTNQRVIAYYKDPMVLTTEIPQPYETFGPVSNDGGLSFKVKIRERHGGIKLRYPVGAGHLLAPKE